MKQTVSAMRIIKSEYERNPSRSMLAIGSTPATKRISGDSETCIGAWDERLQRFVQVAGKLITGEWCSMPYEFLVNGERIPIDWRAISIQQAQSYDCQEVSQ